MWMTSPSIQYPDRSVSGSIEQPSPSSIIPVTGGQGVQVHSRTDVGAERPREVDHPRGAGEVRRPTCLDQPLGRDLGGGGTVAQWMHANASVFRERDGGDAGVEVDDERHRADTDEEKGPAHAGVWMRSHEVSVGSLTVSDYSAIFFTALD